VLAMVGLLLPLLLRGAGPTTSTASPSGHANTLCAYSGRYRVAIALAGEVRSGVSRAGRGFALKRRAPLGSRTYDESMEKRFDLVLFDMGGVVGDIDRAAFVSAATEAGVDPRPALAFWRAGYEGGADDDHPIHRAERGELTSTEFLQLAESTAPGASFLFDPHGPGFIMRFVRPSADWGEVATAAKGRGLRIGALTNTMDGLAEADVFRVNPAMHAHGTALFGRDILESHLLRARKPSAAAFGAAAAYFEVNPSRVLFIDDEPGNCEGARSFGMTAVHNDGPAALQSARQLLSL
jgi:FMN phosphatase YigB (HAD superfamily)